MDLRDFRQRQKTTTSFDSNSITPGTEFMERLSQALRYYVINRVSADPGLCVCVCVCVCCERCSSQGWPPPVLSSPCAALHFTSAAAAADAAGAGWRNIYVIFSDANMPGEGEHKIMDFIRRQQVAKGYNPNLRCVEE